MENDYIGTATYSPEDNKLRLYPLHRLPKDLYERVRAAGFIWAGKQELFVAPAWRPGREDLLLELCGEVGDEDTSLVDRAEQRADRFEGYGENRAADAENARAAVSAIADNIPLGQPILVGHHSERHARKDAAKIENGMRKAVKMWETSKYWEQRAAGAIANAKYKERPDVRARRIKTIEADKRRVEREIKECADKLKLWSVDGMTLEHARKLANYANPGVCKQEGERFGYWNAWDVLQPDESRYKACPSWTVEQVQEAAKRAYTAGDETRARWIAHYGNRLAYERAMLNESGYVEPPKAATRAALPLLNYPGPASYVTPWRSSDGPITAEAVPMTKAEYAKLYSDYRGTYTSADGTHRVRVARHGVGKYGPVFLSDMKVTRPGDVAAKIEKAQAKIAEANADHRAAVLHNRAVVAAVAKGDPAPKRETDPRDAEFSALKQAAKAGVQVVSAPQLFPTPAALAARMVEMAGIRAEHRVLEPSGGTGSILRAVQAAAPGVDLVAVEIKPQLADVIRTAYRIPTHCRDFLECNGDLGTFDRVLMNPPFENGSDIKHIKHALRMLKPGGQLVAICANGPRQREQLMPLATHWEDLPAGTFKEAGTMVNAALLVIDAGASL